MTIEIVPNRLPEPGRDAARIAEDSTAIIHVLDNDRDPDGDPISLDSVTDAANGSAHVDGDTVVFVPDPDWSGSAELEYVVADDRGGSALGRVIVEVTPVNDPPTARRHTTHLKPDRAIEFNLALLVSDPDGGKLTYEAIPPKFGRLERLGSAAYRYTPEDGFTGEVTILYRATDPSGLIAQGEYVLVIEGVTAEAIAAPTLVGTNDPSVPESRTGVVPWTPAGVEVPGLSLMVGAAFETVESLTIPSLILLAAFLASILIGLPRRRRAKQHSADS